MLKQLRYVKFAEEEQNIRSAPAHTRARTQTYAYTATHKMSTAQTTQTTQTIPRHLLHLHTHSMARHPNIIEFLGVCTSASKMCLVTEYMKNGRQQERGEAGRESKCVGVKKAGKAEVGG